MTLEIARRLVQLRKENGMSQEELAGRLDVSRQAVSKWERGESAPELENVSLDSRAPLGKTCRAFRQEIIIFRDKFPEFRLLCPVEAPVKRILNALMQAERKTFFPQRQNAVPQAALSS